MVQASCQTMLVEFCFLMVFYFQAISFFRLLWLLAFEFTASCTSRSAEALTVEYDVCLCQEWPNFVTRGPNSRLPGHCRARYSAIYVTSSIQCCCTAVPSWKGGAWKNAQDIWRVGLNWSARRSLATHGLCNQACLCCLFLKSCFVQW